MMPRKQKTGPIVINALKRPKSADQWFLQMDFARRGVFYGETVS
uniref:Uncharacterized protein n=1 Tax=Aegilops tauschii subsp. strangulata TaxID=200361 RepID=A0A453QW21_AEGTS